MVQNQSRRKRRKTISLVFNLEALLSSGPVFFFFFLLCPQPEIFCRGRRKTRKGSQVGWEEVMGSQTKEGRDPAAKPWVRGSQAETVASSVYMLASPAMLFISSNLVKLLLRVFWPQEWMAWSPTTLHRILVSPYKIFFLVKWKITKAFFGDYPEKFYCCFIFKLISLTHTFLSYKHCPWHLGCRKLI